MPTVEEVVETKDTEVSPPAELKVAPVPRLDMRAVAQISFVKALLQECTGDGEATLSCSPRESFVGAVGRLSYTLYTVAKGESRRYLMHFVFKDDNDALVCDYRINHDDLCTRYSVPFAFDADFIDKVLGLPVQCRETDASIIVLLGSVKFALPKLSGEKNVLRLAKA